MPKIEIRPAIATDIPHMMAIDHNYTSEYVWQMELQAEDSQIGIIFREVHLPRSVQVSYPRDPQNLADDWTYRSGLLVAVIDGLAIGYVGLMQNITPVTTWITDLAVSRHLRHNGIGTALVMASLDWAQARKSRRLLLEMQPKNYPALRLAKKLGFDFCGYNDRYYANHDIGLFFAKWLR